MSAAQTLPGASPAPATRAASPRTPVPWSSHVWLWIPRCVATGVGPAAGSPRLKGTDVLVYLALLARSDNRTRLVKPDMALLARRCGCHVETVRTAVRRLQTAGLVTVERAGRGRAMRLRVVTGQARDHLAVPEAALWPQTYPSPPRWGRSEVSDAVRALFALLLALPHPKPVSPRVSMHLPARVVAERAGLHVTRYWAGLSTLAGPGKDDATRRRVKTRSCGWVTVQARYQGYEDGQQGVVQDSSLVILDWSVLPAAVDGPGPVQQVVPGLENGLAGDAEDTDFCYTEDTDFCYTEDTDFCYTEDTDFCYTEDTDSCSSNTSDAFTPTSLTSAASSSINEPAVSNDPPRSHAPASMEEVDPTKNDSDDPDAGEGLILRVRQTATSENWRLSDQVIRDAMTRIPMSGHPDSYHLWEAVVIANLRHTSPGHKFTLSGTDVAGLSRLLHSLYATGWDPVALAEELIRQPTTGLRSQMAGLTHRLKAARQAVPRTVCPSDADGPWAAYPQQQSGGSGFGAEAAASVNPVWGDSRAKTYTSQM